MRFLLGILSIMFSVCYLQSAGAVFIKADSLGEAAIYKVQVGLDNNIYAVSQNTFFKSEDNGVSWESVFTAKGENIKDIYVDRYLYDTVYIITESSIYRFSGGRKKKIFSFPSKVKGLCVYKCKGIVYAGTTDGIYYAPEELWKWSKLKGLSSEMPVYSICCLPGAVLAASSDGVYVSRKGGAFTKEFVLKGAISEKSGNDEGEELVCRKIAASIFNPEIIYLGTSAGLFISSDKGHTWRKVVSPSMLNIDIRDIAQSYTERNNIYLATDRGIFSLDIKDNTSRPLFEGLTTRDITGVSFNREGVLFAAASKGLFWDKEGASSASFAEISRISCREPSIREIQEAAMRYNDVHPDKVRKWREALKRRAWAPTITTKVGGSVGNTYEIYTSSSKYYYTTGPADRNTSWGVTMSWDMANLIWNSYEDDVDTRSRLTTQLRINILDDINTTYFERLRIKERLMDKSYSSRAERLKDELRLKELTASLDGYTGGYFSRRMRELRKGVRK